MKLKRAVNIANKFKQRIEPYCVKVIIAGSIRRNKPNVKDIEILAEPHIEVIARKPFPPIVTMNIIPYFNKLHKNPRFRFEKDGNKFKKIWLLTRNGKDLIAIDLWLVIPPDQWGTKLLIRTGPESFSKWLVTVRKPQGYKFKNNQLFDPNDDLIPTPTEDSVFKALDLPFIPIQDRENY